MHKAIFLDRDGVINEERINQGNGCVYNIEHYHFIPGAFEALRLAQQSGYKLIIVTNQGGIGKNYYSEETYQSLTRWIEQQFWLQGITINQIYHCPHHPEAVVEHYKINCLCRKPAPGMILQAAAKHNIDLSQSFMIGDTTTDIQAGKNAGCTTILVKTGYGGSDQRCQVKADYTNENLLQAIKMIIKNS